MGIANTIASEQVTEGNCSDELNEMSMPENGIQAPGQPGEKPYWLSGAKSGIGKALNAASNVSFTLSHGIINEVYFPREDQVCINQIGFIVTDSKGYFSEEKGDTIHDTQMYADGVPAYTMVNTCKDGKYVLEKEVITDPIRNSLLQLIHFKPLLGKMSDYSLFMFVSPHLKNNASANNGWIGSYKGVPMLFAERNGVALAVASSIPWKKRSVGFKGVSDGVKELQESGVLSNEYTEAYGGNIMFVVEIDIANALNNELIISVGFGASESEAANHALCSLLDGYETAKNLYVTEWKKWQRQLYNLTSSASSVGKDFRTSAAVLKMNMAKAFPGGTLASMSIPWGEVRSEDDLGGYHLVWPRDLVETSWGLLALNAKDDALQVVNYLMSTQESNGSWPQNMWLDGKPYWTAVQMDQVGLPLLIMNTCYHAQILDVDRLKRYWEGIKLAATFIVTNGPFTQQDRWEMQSGISPFTIAAEIGGLLAAAEFADIFQDEAMAQYCRDTADLWNENIELWTYVTDTTLTRQFDVEGYYIRINPSELPINQNKTATIEIRNLQGDKVYAAVEIISVDALALVRFGLRKPDDPRILNTIKLIDGILKVDTPYGPCWRRFPNDAYGEDDEGNPYFEGGKGRAWPLLTGERAHYEVAAGNYKQARALLQTMESFAYHGMLPEQIWDAPDIPEKELFAGKYTGSAMPLTWAHAEYVKLCSSIGQKKVFDMPEHTYNRYIVQKTRSKYAAWRFAMQIEKISRQKEFLRIEIMAAAKITWTLDNWESKTEVQAVNSNLGVFYADFPLKLVTTDSITFTFFWTDANKWENKDFTVQVTN